MVSPFFSLPATAVTGSNRRCLRLCHTPFERPPDPKELRALRVMAPACLSGSSVKGPIMKLQFRTLAAAAVAAFAAASAVSCAQSPSANAPATMASPSAPYSNPAESKTPSNRPDNQCKNLSTAQERQDCMNRDYSSSGTGSSASPAPAVPASSASRVAP